MRGVVAAELLERRADSTGLLMSSRDEHRSLLTGAGFSQVQVFEQRTKGWISAIGLKA